MSRFKDTSRWTQATPTKILDGDPPVGGEDGKPKRDLGFYLRPILMQFDLEVPEVRVGLEWHERWREGADPGEPPEAARHMAWSSLLGTATTRDRLLVVSLGHEGEPHARWDRRRFHIHIRPLPEGFVRKRVTATDRMAGQDLTDEGILRDEPGRLSWSPANPEEREPEFREERMYLTLYADREAWAPVLRDLLRSARPPARIRLSAKIELWEHEVDGFFNHGEWPRDLGLLATGDLRFGASTRARLESLAVEFPTVALAAAPSPDDDPDDAPPASAYVQADPTAPSVRAVAQAQERLATAVRRGSLLVALAIIAAALWIGA